MAGEIDYRQLAAPALIDTSTYNDGSVQAAASLANAFKSFADTTSELGRKINTDEAAKKGEAQGAAGLPEFKTGFFSHTAASEAYNNAALRSYSIRAQGDAEENAARLEIQANADPDTFKTTFGAFADATIAHAPPEARAMVTSIYNRRMAEGMTRVITQQQQGYQQQARVDISEGIARSTDRIANWEATDDPKLHAEAGEERVRLGLMIDGAKNDGTLTEPEAFAAHNAVQHSITSQTVTYRFKQEIQNPYGDPVGFLERLEQANRGTEGQADVLDPQEKQKLVDTLFQTLHQQNSMDAFDKRKNGTLEQLKFKQGDQDMTAELLAGTLTRMKLLNAVTSQNLTPERALTLMDALEKPDPGRSDPKAKFDVETNLLNIPEADIATNSRLSYKDRSELILKRREQDAGWHGTQQAREGAARIDRALGIVPGTDSKTLSDADRLKRQAALTLWYDEVDKLPPAERQGAAISTAETVIGVSIRKAKAQDATDWRASKARYIASHPVERMGKAEKTAYDSQIARYDATIAADEAAAGRK